LGRNRFGRFAAGAAIAAHPDTPRIAVQCTVDCGKSEGAMRKASVSPPQPETAPAGDARPGESARRAGNAATAVERYR